MKINISYKEKNLSLYILLALITLAVFWQVNQFDFVNIDDGVYVTENSNIRTGINLQNLKWSLFSVVDGNWHPLTWLSLMLDYQLYGLNAGGYHMTNLVLHIFSTLLLFRLFSHMTGALWRSAFVAALFGIHPLHVESVAWIAERKDVLSGFFWMLTLCLYVYYTEKPLIRRYLLVLFSFVLALMSKPIVVTLPVILILLDYWPLNRFKSQKGNFFIWQLKEKLPLFLLSIAISCITLFAHFKPLVKYYPLYYRIINAPVAFVIYLERILWPYDLVFYYPFSMHIPIWHVFGSIFLIIVFTVSVIFMGKKHPYLLVGWVWHTLTIIPVIGIIKNGLIAMADRYTYLSAIGLAVMLVWGIPALITSEKIRKYFLFPAGIVFLVAMALLARQQCGYWQNSTALSKHALDVTKNNHMAHGVLANTFFNEGKIEEAINHFNEALRINPHYYDAYKNRGLCYFKHGQYHRAIEDLNKAILLRPDHASYYYYRGYVYDKIGQHQNAINDYSGTIRLKPDYADAYNNRGGVYFKIGQYKNTIDDYSEIIRLKPDYADAYNNRAFVYLEQGAKELGCSDARKACELGNCRILKGAKERELCR